MKRVISISVVYCHATSQGMVTIFYNDSHDDQTLMKVQNCHEYGLFALVMDTYSTWSTQQEDTLTKTQPLQGAGELISVS